MEISTLINFENTDTLLNVHLARVKSYPSTYTAVEPFVSLCAYTTTDDVQGRKTHVCSKSYNYIVVLNAFARRLRQQYTL